MFCTGARPRRFRQEHLIRSPLRTWYVDFEPIREDEYRCAKNWDVAEGCIPKAFGTLETRSGLQAIAAIRSLGS
jgi:hypothetical protein